MSSRQGKQLIEVDTDAKIWTCDFCGVETTILKGADRFPSLPPSRWIGVRIFGEDPATADENWQFCQPGCAGHFLIRKAQTLTEAGVR